MAASSADNLASLGDEVEAAVGRIASLVRRTPLERDWTLSAHGTSVHLKLESEQVTGSFKARGAVNKLRSLTAAERAAGVCTASTGNHALATAYALRSLPEYAGVAARIFLPKTVARAKHDALVQRGAPIHVIDGRDCVQAEMAALAWAKETGSTYISPYNDIVVAAGQGTIGIEIHEQLAEVGDTSSGMAPDSGPLVVIVPVGGGGLIAGTAAGIKRRRPHAIVIGSQPANSNCMWASVRAGRILTEAEAVTTTGATGSSEYVETPTWSDGTAGGIEAGAVTFAACAGAVTDEGGVRGLIRAAKSKTTTTATTTATTSTTAEATAAASPAAPAAPSCLVDGMVLVSEAEVEAGMMHVLAHHHKVVEGSAGTGVAAALRLADDLVGCTVVVVCCGSNISVDKLRKLLAPASA